MQATQRTRRLKLSLLMFAVIAICILSAGSGSLPYFETAIALTGADSLPSGSSLLAGGDHDRAAFPTLTTFAEAVADGDGARAAGVYVQDVLALRILQQPAGNPGYVTNQPDAVSQFSMAAPHGTLGLLAHNYLAGEQFFGLEAGQIVVIVSENGSRQRYRIDSVRRFQALSPASGVSDFLDLDAEDRWMTARELFNVMYAAPGQLVFQTCIENNGNSYWGRLFVVATPVETLDNPLKMLMLAELIFKNS